MSETSLATEFEELATVPSVSFDINLGRQIEWIDFDYVAYTNYLQQKGLSTQDIEETSIHFMVDQLGDEMGGYDSGIKTMEVYYICIGKDQDVEKSLAHETGHRIQDALGEFNWVSNLINATQHTLQNLGAATTIAGSIAVGAGAVEHASDVKEAGAIASASGMGFILLSQLIYTLDPSERGARRAEKEMPTVLSLRTNIDNHREL
jgi:hypothetical protein